MREWEASLQLQMLEIDNVSVTNQHIEVYTHIARSSVKSPHCGRRSRSDRSHYRRRLKDLPLSQLWVCLVVCVRRFRCRHEQCCHQTFADVKIAERMVLLRIW